MPSLMALAPEDATTVSDGMIVSLNARPHLYVCVSCRRRGAAPVAEGEQTDGRRLYDALKSLADGMGQDAPVQVVPRSASPIASAAARASRRLENGLTLSASSGRSMPPIFSPMPRPTPAKTGVVLPLGDQPHCKQA